MEVGPSSLCYDTDTVVGMIGHDGSHEDAYDAELD